MFGVFLVIIFITCPLFSAQAAKKTINQSAQKTIQNVHSNSSTAFAAGQFIKLLSRKPGWVVYRLDDEGTTKQTLTSQTQQSTATSKESH